MSGVLEAAAPNSDVLPILGHLVDPLVSRATAEESGFPKCHVASTSRSRVQKQFLKRLKFHAGEVRAKMLR